MRQGSVCRKTYIKNKIAQKNNLGEFFHLQKAPLTPLKMRFKQILRP
jgi:hypothetical protein